MGIPKSGSFIKEEMQNVPTVRASFKDLGHVLHQILIDFFYIKNRILTKMYDLYRYGPNDANVACYKFAEMHFLIILAAEKAHRF